MKSIAGRTLVFSNGDVVRKNDVLSYHPRIVVLGTGFDPLAWPNIGSLAHDRPDREYEYIELRCCTVSAEVRLTEACAEAWFVCVIWEGAHLVGQTGPDYCGLPFPTVGTRRDLQQLAARVRSRYQSQGVGLNIERLDVTTPLLVSAPAEKIAAPPTTGLLSGSSVENRPAVRNSVLWPWIGDAMHGVREFPWTLLCDPSEA